MFTSPSLKVVIKPDRGNKYGEIPIYLQYIQNRKVNRISLKKRILPENWADGAQGKYIFERGKNANPLGKELNFFIQKQLIRAKRILAEFEQMDKPINFSVFKDRFLGTNKNDFLAYAEKHIEVV